MSIEQSESGVNKALSESEPAIEYLERSIRANRNWYTALLESIALWTKAEELHNGRLYRYLIAGEAFDWLLLAERLCDAVNSLVPENEKIALLFHGEPPLDINAEEFKELIGDAKYHHYLNFFYGVIAEEALVLAVEDEIRKEKRASGNTKETEVTNEAYRRIYGSLKPAMLHDFRTENALPQTRSIDLTELKEFAYWRFKFRLKMCEKAKVASDSKKALVWLNERGVRSYSQRRDLAQSYYEDIDNER
jgi:hypothetical protein